MKNKGFTLIELLAVIVILAIIALIATPIVLNIINDTRESSNERSMELYARAVQNALAHYMMLYPEDTDVTFDDIEKYISYDGAEVSCGNSIIKEDGSIVLDDCTINGEVGYSYGVSDNNVVCTMSKESIIYTQFGTDSLPNPIDVVTCGDEQFYVMSNDGTNITMLAKYNLSTTVSPYLQSSTNAGVVPYFEASPEINASNSDDDRYTEESNIYPYIQEYQKYLVDTLGVSSASARLLKYFEATNLGCSSSFYNGSCTSSINKWIYSTTYWLADGAGTEIGDDFGSVVIYSDGSVNNSCYGALDSDGNRCIEGYGIRPVVTISASQVE